MNPTPAPLESGWGLGKSLYSSDSFSFLCAEQGDVVTYTEHRGFNEMVFIKFPIVFLAHNLLLGSLSLLDYKNGSAGGTADVKKRASLETGGITC